MSEMHTPGPWFVTSENDYPTGQVSTSPLGNGDICVIYNENAKADAWLIAAAPELLAALRSALKALDAIAEEMTVGERYTNAGQYLLDALEPAEAAIKKATGKS